MNTFGMTPIIISENVPRYESTMYMAIPRVFRWPWQSRYIIHARTRVWHAMLRVGDTLICHPSDYQTLVDKLWMRV